jgi:ABC-type hemin transport system ATPase subunit
VGASPAHPLAALARERNVLLLGPPGSGKSTTLRKLAGDLRKEGRQVALVNAGAARSTEDLLALVTSELDLPELQPDPNLATPVVSLVRSVRHIAQAPQSAILLDDPQGLRCLSCLECENPDRVASDIRR